MGTVLIQSWLRMPWCQEIKIKPLGRSWCNCSRTQKATSQYRYWFTCKINNNFHHKLYYMILKRNLGELPSLQRTQQCISYKSIFQKIRVHKISPAMNLEGILATAFSQCKSGLEYPRALCQNLIHLHWQSHPGNPKVMNCGILFNMPFSNIKQRSGWSLYTACY